MSTTIGAVSFDFGETLATLDEQALSRKLLRHGVHVDSLRILKALPVAWERYQRPVRHNASEDGADHHPWRPFMLELLRSAGATHPERHRDLVEWLFEDQRTANLWRKPILGMIELVRELNAREVPVCVLSNSEGFLVNLIDELGWTAHLPLVIDSGCVGMAKPERAIFELCARTLKVALPELLHVGDSLRADVHGARDAGAKALWFTTPPAYPVRAPAPASDVLVSTNATEARAAIFGALGLEHH